MMDIWTPEIVRARFHEAADTERYLERPRLPTGNGYWPLTLYTAEDREGWTQATKDDQADRWARSLKLTREAIARHDACLNWTIALLTKEEHRHIVWKWAFCAAYGRSFSAVCQRNGWNLNTSYSRLDRFFFLISDYLINTDMMLILPEEKYLEQPEISIIEPIQYAPRMSAPIVHPPFRTDKHYDTLTTPEAVV